MPQKMQARNSTDAPSGCSFTDDGRGSCSSGLALSPDVSTPRVSSLPIVTSPSLQGSPNPPSSLNVLSDPASPSYSRSPVFNSSQRVSTDVPVPRGATPKRVSEDDCERLTDNPSVFDSKLSHGADDYVLLDIPPGPLVMNKPSGALDKKLKKEKTIAEAQKKATLTASKKPKSKLASSVIACLLIVGLLFCFLFGVLSQADDPTLMERAASYNSSGRSDE